MDDAKWPEVTYINSYAVFMGSLAMSIKALSIFLFTWITAVLLGGFVSTLGKKDFWCLTGIILLQPAGYQHDVWAAIARESQKLVMLLATVPGEIGAKVRDEMSLHIEAIIITLESILECQECDVVLQKKVVEIALDLSLDTSSMTTSGSIGRIFNWILLLVFLLADEEVRSFDTPTRNSSDTGRLAGETMRFTNQELPLQQLAGYVLRDLTAALVNSEDISTRVHAAKILDYLCLQYGKDDEFLKELKKAMVDLMPKVLREILGYGSTGEVVTKANSPQSPSQDIDLEMDGVSGGAKGCNQASSAQQQTGYEVDFKRLQKELTKLCKTISSSWYRKDEDVACQLDEIAGKVCLEQGKPDMSYKKLVEEEWKKYQ